jgi:hypothetical protein
MATNYSLAYVSKTGLTSLKIEGGFYVAKLGQNANTSVCVAPSDSGVVAAMTAVAATLSKQASEGKTLFYQSLVDPDESELMAYPICMFTYFEFHAGRLLCNQLHDVLYFIYWAWTNQKARVMAADFGATTLPEAVSSVLILALSRVECGGNFTFNQVLVEVSPTCPKGAALMWPCCHQHRGMLCASAFHDRELMQVASWACRIL